MIEIISEIYLTILDSPVGYSNIVVNLSLIQIYFGIVHLYVT